MNPGTRYILANCRLAALAEIGRWSEDDVLDVAALAPAPALPYEEWMRRREILTGSERSPSQHVSQEDETEMEDPVTTASVRAILEGKADELVKAGILTVTEVKVA